MRGCFTELFYSGRLCGHDGFTATLLVTIATYNMCIVFLLSYIAVCLPRLSVRGGKEFLSFDLDTLFDVNSIVSEVLL